MSAMVKFTDRGLMLRAIKLAKKCKTEPGKQFPSPKVGAVIARDGEVIGEAYRGQMKAGDHAEYTLMEKMLGHGSLKGLTLYTTLEPCISRGEGKVPCAQRCIDRGLGKVFIGTLDYNPDVRGLGEIQLIEAGIHVARFDSDLIQTLWKMNRDFMHPYRAGGPLSRTTPVRQVGPNGYPVGYTENGDQVEWLPDDEDPGEVWPMILRRNDNDILATYKEFWDKIWWNRNHYRLHQIKTGKVKLTPEQRKLELEISRPGMERVEKMYGSENLVWDDVEWGIIQGRMSALSWVMGADWDESMDT